MAIVLEWNVAAEKFYESGLDRGVLYMRDGSGNYPTGVAWEGLINITEKPGGAEVTDLYANNVKYAQLVSAETFEGTIEAYTYPDEFLAADGVVAGGVGLYAHQQTRGQFALAYRSYVGSEAAGQTAAYKIHIIYGCLVQPSEVARNTINDSPEAGTFSWDFKTTPVSMGGQDPVSKLTLDTRTLTAGSLAAIESQLYGDDVGPITPNLPLPDALVALLVP